MQRFRLSEYGVTFATRERAADLVKRISLPPSGGIEVDFSGVKATSPSFLDELFGQIAERGLRVDIVGTPSELEALIGRVLQRRGLGNRFRICAAA